MRIALLLPIGLFSPAHIAAQQFTPLDLGTIDGIPGFISAPSPQVAYAGVNMTGSANTKVYGRTLDGGATWTTHSVPDPADRSIASLFAWNDSTVFACMTDFVGGNDCAIWRTTDHGTNWTALTTTEFNNGFLDFCYFASADSGVAVGDPNGGYFEVWTTTDGGATWTRTPQADLPAPLSGEYPYTHVYSAAGHSLWCGTNKGRVLMTHDLGLTWSLSPIPAGPPSDPNVTFSDALHGASHHVLSFSAASITIDGGAAWTVQPISPMINIVQIQAIPGIPGVYVFTSQSPMALHVTVDDFQSYSLLDDQLPYSLGAFQMVDATTGWIANANTFEDSAMIKIGNVFNAVPDRSPPTASLSVFPNPAGCGAALVTVNATIAGPCELNVRDARGTLLRTQTLGTGGPHATVLDLKGMSAGVYLVELRAMDAVSTTRLVVR